MDSEVTISSGDYLALIYPKTGASLGKFSFKGNDLLYPLRFEYAESKRKIRGGIPILFPNAGSITEKKEMTLPQNGFARDMAWETEENKGSRACFSLSSNKETKRMFPFDFKLTEEVSLGQGYVNILLSIENFSNKTMPVAPGFHPYFPIPVEKKKNIKTNLKGFNPKKYDWCSTLCLPLKEDINLSLTDKIDLRISVKGKFNNWTVWSEPEKPFVCIEPWTGKPNAIFNPKERVEIKPNSKEFFSLRIERI
ncbi:hypothetical protein C4578_01795 [Candidatus Microgenomates bacterium]|jgi:galactose mutarotase-like enzyme|nr:MAG: hypothetical protein C4578_01795 [Candidatus Microgenomates bacterium]